MAERPVSPPPEKPVRQITTPDHTVGFYTELVSRESARFIESHPIKRGTLYDTTTGADTRVSDAYANALYFCKEIVPYGSTTVNTMQQDQWVVWVWSTSPDAEGQHNAEVSYLLENVSFPAYARVFQLRRDAYEASPTVATGTAYTALVGVKVTAGGSGYTSAPTVTISSGSATAEAVINDSGAVSHVIITSEGSGYDSAALPTISFSGGGGSGATAVALVQPKTALLVSQKKLEYPDTDPLSHQFVRVVRVWETIPGPTLTGQRYNRKLDIIETYTKRIEAAGTSAGTNRKEIVPIDSVKQETITHTPNTSALDAYAKSFPGTSNIQLPDVLESAEVVWESSAQSAAYDETGTGASGGTSAALSLNLSADAQASAAIMPDLRLNIKQVWAQNVPIMHYFFFLADPVTEAAVLAKLTTLAGASVTAWPTFRPVAHTVTLRGQKLSLNVKANVQQHVSISPSNTTYTRGRGAGSGRDVGLTIKTIRIPPTIHGLIDLGNTAEQEEITVTATADMDGGVGFISMEETASEEGEVIGRVYPGTLAATSPSSIPTSGKRLKDVDIDTYGEGYSLIHAEVFDFANLA